MKQKGFAQIIIIVLVVLVAIGYFGYKHFQSINIPINYLTNPSAVPSTTSNVTTSLKTYTNSSVGFTFMYPNTLVIKTEKDLGTNTGDNSIYLLPAGISKPNLEDAIVRIGHVTSVPAYVKGGIPEFFQNLSTSFLGTIDTLNMANPGTVKLRTMSVDKHEALEIYSLEMDERSSNYLSRKVTIKQNDKSLINLNTIVHINTKDYFETVPFSDPFSTPVFIPVNNADRSREAVIDSQFDQILSTFKFTN